MSAAVRILTTSFPAARVGALFEPEASDTSPAPSFSRSEGPPPRSSQLTPFGLARSIAIRLWGMGPGPKE